MELRFTGQGEMEHYSAQYTGSDRRHQDAQLGLIDHRIRGKRQLTNEYRHRETDTAKATSTD